METATINRLSFVNSNLDAFMSHLESSYLNQNRGAFIVTANPEIGYKAVEDEDYGHVLASSDFILPDGIGVVMVSKLIGHPLQGRIAGYDIFTSLLTLANDKKKKIFLYGATKDVLDSTIQRIKLEYPNIELAGSSDGFVEDKEKVAKEIAAAKPDLVFVALGFPNQEHFIYQYRHLFPQATAIGLGGSFDVFSGTAKRAPEFFIKLNLEWFYRLISNPSRWRRMLNIPKYFLAVIRNERDIKKYPYPEHIKDSSRNM
ncbi:MULTISPECIES: WecB/TagA/CpsF family glycosyltransferase [Bacillus]|uniref:N-acetylglucosaminyldiphosphoundecaprenol N-acetyl-beta-D-mannosaminyltransferase n=2 Tax=Bacillus TaxID=1386 RepID=A0A0M4FSK6_9BACI|nr:MULTISPECIES: WecB/TagA/CpsF family glycosyltransferase [Bacillus]ALC82534.1 N-acetylmannosaminyltransferase [Bacillus gobiensis]MBP1081439.1 N-acetylglucosaminyldiphosphoundecaprenol N-acetyl-beta-D-mannosaminyltransferase [Bacillus capparidis]MED1096110.1 WecB/TagA/CpsF family glycosyltransferase [Bacillus capparidis]